MALITIFDPWRSKLCTCPAKYSLSAYTGCGHGCLYCYASSYILNFSSPRPKKDFIKRLEREIIKIPKNSFITLANSSDPYQPLEKKLKLTRQALEILKDYDLRIMLVTKSSLILRDLDLFKTLKKIVVAITLTSLNEKLTKKLEPKASSPKERLKAIESLSKDIPVVCRFDPLIYPLNTKEIEKIIKAVKKAGAKQIITSTYKVKGDNFKRMFKAFPEQRRLWQDFYMTDGHKINGCIYLQQSLRKKLIEEVRNAALGVGLEFSTCREGFKYLNTKTCDGSSYFIKK